MAQGNFHPAQGPGVSPKTRMSVLNAESTEHLHGIRQLASSCLVGTDPDWADGLILLGSPGAW